MITIELPLDSKSVREGKALEKEMRSLGVKYDFKKEALSHFESEIKANMRRFKDPVTGKPVRFNLKKKMSGLVLNVDIDANHKDKLSQHLGLK